MHGFQRNVQISLLGIHEDTNPPLPASATTFALRKQTRTLFALQLLGCRTNAEWQTGWLVLVLHMYLCLGNVYSTIEIVGDRVASLHVIVEIISSLGDQHEQNTSDPENVLF